MARKFVIYMKLGRSRFVFTNRRFFLHFRASSCQSFIDIYDGPDMRSKYKTERLCSPVEKHARDTNGR